MAIHTFVEQRPGWIGQPVKRREDSRLLVGNGRFVDDIHLPGTLHLAFVRSTQPHARLVRVEVPDELPPGVVLILTAEQVNAQVRALPLLWQFPGLRNAANPCMAQGKVRYVGEAVALVVATDRYAAVDALDLVRVEYEPLAAVIDAEQALRPGAPLLYEEWQTNAPCPAIHVPAFPVGTSDVEEVFRQADLVIRVPRLVSQRLAAAPMETRGCVATYDRADEVLTLFSSTQVPNQVRTAVAQALGMGESGVRVLAHDVGGGFGSKAQAYPEEVVVSYVARRLGRPIKWIEGRAENFVASTHDREQIHRDIELAVAHDGQLLGLRDHIILDVGAHFTSRGPIAALITGSMLPGPYRLGAASIEVEAVCTNKPPEGPYRGFGMPEAVFVMERLLDIAAEELWIDPAELRRRNLLAPQEVPTFQTATGITYDNGNYPLALARSLELIGYEGVRARQRGRCARRAPTQEPLEGVGLSFVIEFSGLGPSWYMSLIGFPVPGNEAATVEIDPSGRVVLRTGIMPIGQGTQTSLAQIAATELGVKLEDVRVLWGDTDSCPYSGMSSTASRGMVVGGSALALSCRKLLSHVKQIAAHLLEAAVEDIEVREGDVYVVDRPEPVLSLADVARAAYLGDKLPAGMSAGLVEREVFDPPAIAYSYAAHAARVEVEPESGAVRVTSYAVVHDCGRVINPMLVEGQIHGGVVQGIGAALQEQLLYDGAGLPLVTTLQSYQPPRAAQVPPIIIEHLETPAPHNPLGAKGMGEGGAIGAPAAIVNAVADALGQKGLAITRTPLTPERVWRLLHERAAAM
jgi:carbon-monoxide dehydrogenase large subunit